MILFLKKYTLTAIFAVALITNARSTVFADALMTNARGTVPGTASVRNNIVRLWFRLQSLCKHDFCTRIIIV